MSYSNTQSQAINADFYLELDDMNVTIMCKSVCGKFMFVQYYDRGEWHEESPVTLEHARRIWKNAIREGYRYIK